MGRQVINNEKWVKLKDHSAASTAAVESDIIDLAGYDGVTFVTSFGTANATNTVKVQGNTANQTTGMTDLADTSLASGSSDEDVIVSLHKPRYRYLQVVAARGASSTLESVWARLYGASSSTTRNSVSGTQIAESHVNVTSGTA